MPRHGRAAGMIAAALLAAAAGTPLARATPADPATPKAPAAAPAQAAAPTAQPFSVKAGTCKGFLELPADLRGLVIAWTAGRYHTLGRWVVDAPTARKVVADVEEQCAKTPGASFRYMVVEEVAKLK